MKRPRLSRVALALVGLFGLIQLVPAGRPANLAVNGEVPAPADARAVLRRSCYDCHSGQTRWPWYSRVAPASWLVAKDVREGRGKVNYTDWNALPAKDRAHALEETGEVVENGEMPPAIYLPLHPDARLSDADRDALRRWLAGQGVDTRPGAHAEERGEGGEGGEHR